MLDLIPHLCKLPHLIIMITLWSGYICLPPFYRGGTWGSERKFPTSIQLVTGKIRIWTQVPWNLRISAPSFHPDASKCIERGDNQEADKCFHCFPLLIVQMISIEQLQWTRIIDPRNPKGMQGRNPKGMQGPLPALREDSAHLWEESSALHHTCKHSAGSGSLFSATLWAPRG